MKPEQLLLERPEFAFHPDVFVAFMIALGRW